jgi:hypothetical protein
MTDLAGGSRFLDAPRTVDTGVGTPPLIDMGAYERVWVPNVGPLITSQAPLSATEDVLYTYQVEVTDPDDANDGVELTFCLEGAPAGMTVSATGLITWTPGEGILTTGEVTVTVADGGEDGAAPTTQSFTIAATPVNDPR